MSQSLPYNGTNFEKNVKLGDILNIPDDTGNGCFVGCDLSYPDFMKEKTKNFPFCHQNKISRQDNFSDYMNGKKTNTYTKIKKVIYDWTD